MRTLFLVFFSLIVWQLNASNNESQDESINWLPIQEALEKNTANPKKIFIDVYTDWCGWCRRMDQNTYSHPFIIEYINKHFYPVKMNGEMKEPITIGDQVYRFVESGRRGYHELPATLLQGRMSYPSIVFLDENNDLLQPIPGYREPNALHMFLQYFGENYYKTVDWEEFEENFESPIK
ncbi:MAG: DUF255 domain-containing protein [Chitinophagaceae bacterium]|nr:MAG: DUF255 domain-containing protein [Chitinophagaceae bacterium]